MLKRIDERFRQASGKLIVDVQGRDDGVLDSGDCNNKGVFV